MRLSPVHPDYVAFYLGESYLLAGDLEQARKSILDHLDRPPTSPVNEAHARRNLAVVYDALGREQVDRLVQVFPQASIAYFRQLRPYKDPGALNQWAETWRRLGMPE